MRITKDNGRRSGTKKPIKSSTNADKQEAIEYIKSAISVLGNSAINGDSTSKDAIANLSVILFDLK